jgi:hypothetical protein
VAKAGAILPERFPTGVAPSGPAAKSIQVIDLVGKLEDLSDVRALTALLSK